MKISDISIKATFGFFAVAALMLYYGGQAAAFFASVLFHELGHLLAIIVVDKGRISIELTAAGVYINPLYIKPISKTLEVLILISGPTFGLMMAILLKHVSTEVFKAGVILSAVNLIPVKGTDGGSILELFTGKKYETIRCITDIAAFVLAVILTLSLYIMQKAFCPVWIAVVAAVYIRGKFQK